MEFAVDHLEDLPAGALDPLVEESERGGLRFVRRLADEWAAGICRFDRPGEALFAAKVGGAVVGVCGLTVDPYTAEPAVGRVRRVYVLRAWRGRGIGSRLVRAAVDAARGRFRLLRLRAENADAARLYERLGFLPTAGVPDCTHVLRPGPGDDPPALVAATPEGR